MATLSDCCHFSIMAAALLSYKTVNNLVRNKAKFTKAFSNSSLLILSKPKLNFVCKQCAAASYFRVCFGCLRYVRKHSQIFKFYLILQLSFVNFLCEICFQFYSTPSPNHAGGGDSAKHVLAAVLANKSKTGKIPVGK